MTTNFDTASFYLIGYTGKYSIDFSLYDYVFHIESDEDKIENYNKLLMQTDASSETGILTIKKNTNQSKLLNYAQDIMNLLSLALGKSIIFNRQEYSIDDKISPVLKEMVLNHNEGKQIVPDCELEKYLEQTFPYWSNLIKEEKDKYFVLIDYLNQTKTGFIEDRILRTMQAWECACNYWIDKVELDDDAKELKKDIKALYRKWKNGDSNKDQDGKLMGKISNAFDQEIIIKKLYQLIYTFKLNVNKINLDLNKLKDLRDQVAHNGRIDIPGKEAINYLNPGIMGLQLILLKKFGYTGKVSGVSNGWSTTENISTYFRQN
jgi:hypothetical protein